MKSLFSQYAIRIGTSFAADLLLFNRQNSNQEEGQGGAK
jgi:hypothetical protein